MDARRLVRQVAARLAAAGVDSPQSDATWLICHAYRLRPGQLPTAADLDETRVAPLVERRARREPLQHILGTAAFRHVELAVGPGVFVPRPETELLVDAVLPALAEGSIAVDLCAGSGALALALADEVPGSAVYAVESDDTALVWLRRNAAGAGVRVVEGDVREGTLLAELAGRVDAVVSNPPYVPAAAPVGSEVRHDPPAAVFAGSDGLAVLPHVVAAAARLLRPGGVLAVEHDDSHGAAVPALLDADARWGEISDHADLAGRPRYATAVRTAARMAP